MEVWMQTTLEIASAFIGLIAVAIAVFSFVRLRSRRVHRSGGDSSDEWVPVGTSYRPKTDPGLAGAMTCTVAQTESGTRHVYPNFLADPFQVTKHHSSTGLFKSPGEIHERDSDHRLTVKQDSQTSLSLPSLSESDNSFHGIDIQQYNEPDGQSSESLREEWASPTCRPVVDFSILFEASTNILTVHVLRIVNLSPKSQIQAASKLVKVKLQSKPKEASSASQKSMSMKKTFDSEAGAKLSFTLLPETDLKSSCLWIYLYERKFVKLKEKLLGELKYSLAQIELCSGIPVTCIQDLIVHKHEKNLASCKEKPSQLDNGQLMLTLFYQVDANRMKVLVRKASNLPKRNKGLGQPEYYVILNTILGRQSVLSQETKTVSGRSPVWNHPFIFDLPEEDLGKYSMQFVVMKSRMNSRDEIVGQVVIGPEVKGTGHAHWIEAVQPRSTEAVKWHKIQSI